MNSKIPRLAKISWKLTAIYALLFFIILFLTNASILYGVRYFLNKQAASEVKMISNNLTLKLEHSSTNPRRLYSVTLFGDLPPIKNMHVIITNELGEIINASSSFRSGVPADSDLKIIKKGEFNNKDIVFINTRVLTNEGITIFMQVVKDTKDETAFLDMLLLLIIIASIGGVIISILIGLLLSKRMLKPIDKITKAAQSISIYDLNMRLEVTGPDDELTRLTKTFNEMIDRLQNSFETQNQFVSDASHELRTPIAVIQGYINLLDRWGKDDKAILEESIEAVKNETINMARLTEKLLFLARGDSCIQKIEKEKFEVSELISEVVRDTRIIAPRHQIEYLKGDSQIIFADPKLIKQMLRAIIDNSIKFTPVNGRIDIESTNCAEHYKIIIKDNGIGIPEEDIPHIFDRFYRVEKSRDKEKGGSGLGLSIVKWIIDSHGGDISVQSSHDEGTCITLTLPVGNLKKAATNF